MLLIKASWTHATTQQGMKLRCYLSHDTSIPASPNLASHLKGWLRSSRYCLAEGVQVDNDKIDGLDLVALRGVCSVNERSWQSDSQKPPSWRWISPLIHLHPWRMDSPPPRWMPLPYLDGLHVRLVVADCKDASVYSRVECLDAAVQHLGEASRRWGCAGWGGGQGRKACPVQSVGFKEKYLPASEPIFQTHVISSCSQSAVKPSSPCNILNLLHRDPSLLDGRGRAPSGDDLKPGSVKSLHHATMSWSWRPCGW